jgi:hypothetical protein
VDITVAPKPIAPYLSAMSVQPPAGSPDRALPLFKRGQEHDDEPLIKMPAAPRPPLLSDERRTHRGCAPCHGRLHDRPELRPCNFRKKVCTKLRERQPRQRSRPPAQSRRSNPSRALRRR